MQDLEAAKLVLYGAIAGALAGILGSVASAFIASRAESKRQLVQLAFQSGLKELELQIQHAKGRAKVYPIAIFIEHHAHLLELIRERKLTVEAYKDSVKQVEAFMKAADESNID